MNLPLELLTTTQMAEADRLAVAAGVPSLTLMENAGRAVAAEAARRVPAGSRIAILAGPGNNGGDGFVAARLLAAIGFDVVLGLLGDRDQLKGDAAAMAGRWQHAVVPLAQYATLVDDADLVIDALFGAGLSRPLDGLAAAAVTHLNASGKTVLAVDVPSGLDGSTGEVRGPTVRAKRTVTFFRAKPGHLLMPGQALCGDLVVADIGIPDAVLAEIAPATLAIHAMSAWWPDLLRRDTQAHKYTLGHALVVSGPPHQTGAARLAVRGAMRSGAGLVSLVSAPEAVAVNAAHLTAAMVKPVADLTELAEGISDRRVAAIAAGPGAGVSAATRRLVATLLQAKAAVVLDADALSAFEAAPENLWALTTPRREASAAMTALPPGAPRAVVLTPHEGEFSRLFADLAGDRLSRARAAAERSGAVVVLKGPDTIVAAPGGTAAINAGAPATLATAGSGDVLCGLVTGLLAQGLPAFHAACAAVHLHAAAARALGPGLVAEDLPEALPRVLKQLLG